jgi:hypothetical protein
MTIYRNTFRQHLSANTAYPIVNVHTDNLSVGRNQAFRFKNNTMVDGTAASRDLDISLSSNNFLMPIILENNLFAAGNVTFRYVTTPANINNNGIELRNSSFASHNRVRYQIGNGSMLNMLHHVCTENFISCLPSDISPTTLRPIWDAHTRSHLIDAGYVGTCYLSWFGNPEFTDADGTRKDIGAMPYGHPQHRAHKTLIPARISPTVPTRFAWVSFPYLDKLHQGYHRDSILYKLGEYNRNDLFSMSPRVLESIEWRYNNDSDIIQASGNQWTPNLYTHRLDSRYGYKISMVNSNVTNDVILSGFLRGGGTTPNDVMTINAPAPGQTSREIWVGYFIPGSECPLFALAEVLPWLTRIQTQRWEMARQPNGLWVGTLLNAKLNFGEMVKLTYVGNTSRNFRWNVRSSGEDKLFSTYVHPRARYFSYVEEANYASVFVEIEEGMIGEEGGEVGLFINGICYGAEVIQDNFAQINAYVLDLPLDRAIIDFRIHQYGRSEARPDNQIVRNFRVFDTEKQEFRSTRLDLRERNQLHIVSIMNEERTRAAGNIVYQTMLEGNYPNPANPSTTIVYSLGQTENVRIQVFNIRGQLVKTLVNETQNAGRHSVIWHGDDNHGRSVSSGVYFYRFETSEGRETRQMMIMK